MPNKILRFPEVTARTGLSRSRLYHAMSEGTFPAAISIGQRAVGRIEAEIDAWVDSKLDQAPRPRGGQQY